MEVICIEEKAFYELLAKVLAYVQSNQQAGGSKWISAEEAMQRLAITSKTTLRQFRNEGLIKFTQPKRKVYLYDAQSIEEYLEKKAKRVS